MNIDTINNLNIFLGTGAIVLQIVSLLVIILLFGNFGKNKILDFVNKNFLLLSFLISFFASVLSLIYSEIIGFIPCHLCWFQRIFIFPVTIILGMAFWNKDRKVIKYVLPLVSFGFLISVYQNLIYYFGDSSNIACDSTGVSCYQRLISEFGGYISLPMLALTSFFSLIVIILVAHFYKKNE
ncbi:MAG: disulfide bond formation protein B [bacterium]